jgi:hypothetical protein
MLKKLLLVLSLFVVFSCEDSKMEEVVPMKLWLNGEEVDVEREYEKITTYGEEVEYAGYDSTITFTKKIFVIHFQKDAGRVELNKEHYAVVFTDWEGDVSNTKPVDEGHYVWPSICSVCPRACMHGAESKWVRMEIPGDDDVSISGEAHLEEVSGKNGSWTISGTAEGIFYNPYSQTNMEGKIEFTNLKIEGNSEESPYYNYGGR